MDEIFVERRDGNLVAYPLHASRSPFHILDHLRNFVGCVFRKSHDGQLRVDLYARWKSARIANENILISVNLEVSIDRSYAWIIANRVSSLWMSGSQVDVFGGFDLRDSLLDLFH